MLKSEQELKKKLSEKMVVVTGGFAEYCVKVGAMWWKMGWAKRYSLEHKRWKSWHHVVIAISRYDGHNMICDTKPRISFTGS